MPVVKTAFTYRFSHGGSVHVPAGARAQKNHFEEGMYWVDPSVFPDPIIRFDAEHYGVRVPADNIDNIEDIK